MLNVLIAFRPCLDAQLRSLVDELIEDGGASNSPVIWHGAGETVVDAKFGDYAGVREISRFVQRWELTQKDVHYFGVREAP